MVLMAFLTVNADGDGVHVVPVVLMMQQPLTLT